VAFARLSSAIVIAFVGMVLVKSRRRPRALWLGRTLLALALFTAALWIVFVTLPHTADAGIPDFSIVGSSVLVAGLAAEEFVGADIRRLLRM
jgi:hypothetical protein